MVWDSPMSLAHIAALFDLGREALRQHEIKHMEPRSEARPNRWRMC